VTGGQPERYQALSATFLERRFTGAIGQRPSMRRAALGVRSLSGLRVIRPEMGGAWQTSAHAARRPANSHHREWLPFL